MAQVIAGDLSKIVGKVGDKVYVRYKGGIYVRKAPTIRKRARTAAMLLNQQRFAFITQFCVQFKHPLISMIWNDATTSGSGYNGFLKANSPAFAKDGTLENPLLLQFSKGDLSMPETMTVQRTLPDAQMIQLNWQKEVHILGIRLKDELMALSYDGFRFSPMMATGITRKGAGGIFALPVLDQKAEYLFLFFAAVDRHSFSISRAFKI